MVGVGVDGGEMEGGGGRVNLALASAITETRRKLIGDYLYNQTETYLYHQTPLKSYLSTQTVYQYKIFFFIILGG